MGFKDDVKALIHPYYWVNIILSLSYIICKFVEPLCILLFQGECTVENRQTEILFFLLMVIMVRARKTGSMSLIAYLTNSFMYCKVANAVLWFIAYKPYGMIFLVLFLLQGLLLPQPIYKGPQEIIYFRDAKIFKEEISKKQKVWLIEFYTAWNPSCVNFAPIYAQISAEYALDTLKFGKIDLGRFPEVGAEYNISDSSFSKQLPTLILFKNGEPVMMRPIADQTGKLVKFHMTKTNVIEVFDLNNLHKELKDAQLNAEQQKALKPKPKPKSGHAKAE